MEYKKEKAEEKAHKNYVIVDQATNNDCYYTFQHFIPFLDLAYKR